MGLREEFLGCYKIDVHTHIGIGDTPVRRGDEQKYIEDGFRVGIRKIIISRPFTGPANGAAGPDRISRANDMVLETIARHRGVVYGYAYLHPGYADEAIREMERCLACPGMVGIKLYNQYFFDDPLVVWLVREATRRGAVVLLHQGKSIESSVRSRQPAISDGTHIARLAAAVPEARLICGHIGGGGDWEWCARSLRDSPSVHVDTSGSVADAGMVELARRELGVERLLFATDMSMDQGVGKILGAGLTDSACRAIFAENAEKLFGEALA